VKSYGWVRDGAIWTEAGLSCLAPETVCPATMGESMKSDFVKVSLALLSAVFILGCQDQGAGAVGVDGLEPQFAKGGKGKPPEADPPRFNVTMNIAGANLSNDLVQRGRVHNDADGILMDNFELDLSFFTSLAELTCGSSGPIPVPGEPVELTGGESDNAAFKQISGGDGSDGFFSFKFTHKDIRHDLFLRATIDPNNDWLPTSNTTTMRERDGGHWSVNASGKGNKKGCTGEGKGVFWTATITPISPE
jgi:hypothetical protein